MNSSRLPPVDPDGTVPCGSCGQRFLVGAMNLTEDGYACAQCSRLRAANAGSSGAALASVSLTDRSWVKPALGVAAVVVVIAIIVAAS